MVGALVLLLSGACTIDQNFGETKRNEPAPTPNGLPPNASTGSGEPRVESLGPEIPLSETSLGADVISAVGGAFDGEIYLVVWRGLRGLVATRLDATGKVLDETPFVLAPPPQAGEIAIDPPHVFARPSGGFRVLWTDHEHPESDALHGLWVERDGTATLPLAIAANSKLAEDHVSTIAPLDPTAASFSTVAETEDGILIREVSFPDPLHLAVRSVPDGAPACAARISIPNLVPGTAVFARSPARNIVGGIVASAAGLAVSIGEFSMPPENACSYDYPRTADVPYTEIARAPLRSRDVTRLYRRPLDVVPVAGGVGAVWVDLHPTPDPLLQEVELHATLVPPAGSAPPSTIAARRTMSFVPGSETSPLLRSFGLASHADEILVMLAPPRTNVAPQDDRVAIRLDPRTMTSTAVEKRDVLPDGGGAGQLPQGAWSIPGPGSDYLVALELKADITLVRDRVDQVQLAQVVGSKASLVPWGATPLPLPGRMKSPVGAQSACSGQSCITLWSHDTDRYGVEDPPNATLVKRGDRAPTLFGILPGASVREAGHGPAAERLALAGGPAGYLAAAVNCSVHVQAITTDGHVGPVRALDALGDSASAPRDGGSCFSDESIEQISLIAEGRGFFGAVRWGHRHVAFRLAADGTLVGSQELLGSRGLVTPLPRPRLSTLGDRTVVVYPSRSVAIPAADAALLAVSFGPDSLTPSPVVDLPVDLGWRPYTTAAVGDRIVVAWVETDSARASSVVRAIDLDGFGRPKAPPRELAREAGIVTDLHLTSDEGDGIALLYAERDFASLPPRLVLRRFDRSSTEVSRALDVARDLQLSRAPGISPGFEASFASSAPGSWFVSYSRPMPAVDEASMLFGRFVTGASLPLAAPK